MVKSEVEYLAQITAHIIKNLLQFRQAFYNILIAVSADMIAVGQPVQIFNRAHAQQTLFQYPAIVAIVEFAIRCRQNHPLFHRLGTAAAAGQQIIFSALFAAEKIIFYLQKPAMTDFSALPAARQRVFETLFIAVTAAVGTFYISAANEFGTTAAA